MAQDSGGTGLDDCCEGTRVFQHGRRRPDHARTLKVARLQVTRGRPTGKPYTGTKSGELSPAAIQAIPENGRLTCTNYCAGHPGLAAAIAVNGQLTEDWPSSGQIRRRLAMYA